MNTSNSSYYRRKSFVRTSALCTLALIVQVSFIFQIWSTTRILKVLPSSLVENRPTSAFICAETQDDEAYIDEWVDYHHALGFSHFYLYDTSVGWELRQWGEEKGPHVTVIYAPGMQGRAVNFTDCIDRNGKNSKSKESSWAAFFNITDFLVLKKHFHVTNFLQEVFGSNINIPMVQFGSAGRRVYSPKPVTKRFLYRSENIANDTISFFSVNDHPKHQREESNTVSQDVAIFHHYTRSLKERVAKMGTVNQKTGVSSQLQPELDRKGILDVSAWTTLTSNLPHYKIYDMEAPVVPSFPSAHNGTAAICAFVLNEEAYIDEWVDYHRALGISHFYIYDNSPTFEMDQWGSEKGDHVTVKHFPGSLQQIPAYMDCLKTFVVKNKHTWVAMLDVDEMVHLKEHNNVVDLLHESCSSGSLTLNWIFFGPSKRDIYQPLPYSQRFKYRAEMANMHVKSFAKVSDIDLKMHPQIHSFYLSNGTHHDVNNIVATEPFYWNTKLPTNVAVVHHYVTKSYKELVTKRMRGRASGKQYNADEVTFVNYKMRRAAVDASAEVTNCLQYSDEGWNSTKTFLPNYQLFDSFLPDYLSQPARIA